MKIIKDSKEIIVVYLLQIILIILSSFICNMLGYDVNRFISNEFYYVIVIFYCFLCYFLIKKYRVENKEVRVNNIILCIYLVLSVSIFLNMIFFKIGIQNSRSSNLNIILLIFSSGILGPIVEEYLFRNILLNRLLNRFSIGKATVLESFIFAFFHSGINGFIYAFIIGIILSFIYVKYKNIKIPIICHMISNIFVLFLDGYSFYILLLSFICLLISGLIIYKNKLYKIG